MSSMIPTALGLDDPEQMQKIVESGQTFGTPIVVVLHELDSQGMLIPW